MLLGTLRASLLGNLLPGKEIVRVGYGNEYVCSYTICVVLAVIVLTISIGIGAYFAYKYLNRNRETGAKESFLWNTFLLNL